MSTTTLTAASRQWSERPADERFGSVQEMHAAALQFRAEAKTSKDVQTNALRVEAQDGDVLLVGKNHKVEFTHWSFGQLSAKVGAPASYLRELPATLAVQNLNHGLKQLPDSNVSQILMRCNGENRLHAITGPDYARIWNSDITLRLQALMAQNPEWQPAPAAFDGSRGLYLSDKDMFAFMVDNGRRIFEQDPGGGLSRGFFIANSQVGDKSLWMMQFMYAYVCGNHMVWGAKIINELRIRHIGDASEKAFGKIAVELKKYSEAGTGQEEQIITRARTMELGENKEAVLDMIFGLRVPALTKNLVSKAYELAVQHEDWYGNPQSVWGMVNGLTEVARDLPFADKRVEVERAAGRLMNVVF